LRICILISGLSPRLEYTLNRIFKERLNYDFELTQRESVFNIFQGLKIQYSKAFNPSLGGLFLWDSGFIHRSDIRKEGIREGEINDIQTLFYYPNSDFGFDLFAAVFYVLSRYEEYLPFQGDEYGRFSAKNSWNFQKNVLGVPIVDHWIAHFEKIIHSSLVGNTPFSEMGKPKRLPNDPFQKPTFLPSFDLDFAWKYNNLGFFQSTKGFLRDILKANWPSLKSRIACLMGQSRDPYDTYDYLKDILSKNDCFSSKGKWCKEPKWFFLLGSQKKGIDRNHSISGKNFQSLLIQLSKLYSVGIHPSGASNESWKILDQERSTFKEILGKNPAQSRQHFLKLRFPETYRSLIAVGIMEDYSMGYADKIGFRAGTAISFPWYDLEADGVTDLMIHPFVIMDVTLKKYLELKPDSIMDSIHPLMLEIKKYGGTFVSLWHNSSFDSSEGWGDWDKAFENLIESIRKEYTDTI
jgi:hypothetical protein